ncbi:hypothetical protein GGR53DRAFT_484813 [Hypoxylon sp. FL1150]|nr:hypothetical protein GGR53DRAFT_484813 [Hypoxylon sp. FL1150]
MPSLKVLIVGGGIAGPALAYWLSRVGAEITLIERSPGVRASGQQLDLRGQGVPMMKKMGIEAAVRAATVHEPGMQLIDIHGKTQAFFPVTQTGSNKQSVTSEFEIMRRDLVQILYKLTEGLSNVKHRFDTTVRSFTQDESNPNGKVHVTFQDGHEEDFDILVAADGTGSKIRKMMLGPDAPDPRYPLGGYIGYFSILSTPEDSDRGTFCFLPGRVSRMVGTRKDCPDLTRVYMIMRGQVPELDAAHKSGNLADLKKAWADLYQDGGWQCNRFFEALRTAPEANDLYCTPFEEVRLPKGSWLKGRVVLIGDAAHSATASGYGTTWGLIGAFILAGEIANVYEKDSPLTTEVVTQAARNYEEKFRPVATAGHGGSQLFESIAAPRSRFGIWILHMFAKIALYFKLDMMEGLDSKTAKWPLPDYPKMEGQQ